MGKTKSSDTVSTITDSIRHGKGDRLLREMVHDPYKSKKKLPEPSICTECGAIFHDGRWQWAKHPPGAHETLCPACHRMRDKVPAGFLTLSGDFLTKHKEEIMNLVHNTEEREKGEHPLERIMDIEEQKEGIVVTFTGAHLARGVGEALHHAYKGELDFVYAKEDNMLRVSWKR